MIGLFTESHFTIRHLLFVLLFIPFVGCKSPSVSYENASRVRGRYNVAAYIVAKDTLYKWPLKSARDSNKLDIGGFAIVVEPIGVNQVQITTSYYRDGAHPTQVKMATVSQEPYEYTIIPKGDSLAAVYDGRIVRNRFYQRQAKGGLYIPITLTGAPVVQTTSQEVTIIALPQ